MNEDKIVSHSKNTLLQRLFFCCPSLFIKSDTKPVLSGEYDLGPAISSNDNQSCFKKTLILDLDETLIYSSFKPFSVKGSDLTVKYQVPNKKYIFSSYIIKRPGLDDFLNYVKEKFEVVIFTASMKEYADAAIDAIAPWIPSSHRFYRNHCKHLKGVYIKDLSKFNRPIESIILIDDSFVALSLNRSNVITIPAWFGEANDRELSKLQNLILPQLEKADDVRNVIRKLV